MSKASSFGSLKNEARPQPKKKDTQPQVVEITSVIPETKRPYFANGRAFWNSLWIPSEDDADAMELADEPFLTRVFCPILDIFIAWGVLAAFFIPTGWGPSDRYMTMINPGIIHTLVIVTGYRTGKTLYGFRGALTGAFVSLGLTSTLLIPGIFPTLVYATLSVMVLRLIDICVDMTKIKSMLHPLLSETFIKTIFITVNVLLVLFAHMTGVDIMQWLVTGLGDITNELVVNSYTPLSALSIEPAKVLFANNALNVDTLIPLGMSDVATDGKSSAFMLESNFGPGLGMLLALMMVGPKCLRAGTVLAAILLFFGGIHEVYFPYVYINPLLILVLIVSSFSGQIVFEAASLGYTGPASPASVFQIGSVVAEGDGLMTWIGISISVIMSFILTFVLYRRMNCRKLLPW